MVRWSRPLVLGSLLSGSIAVSCLVSNVELVDHLPGPNDGGAGADGVAGTTTDAEGGDDPGPVGGADSGGSSTGPGGRAGSGSGGNAPGGSGGNAPGGGGPGGGSGGTGGSSTGGGYTTDPSGWVFGGKGACETAAPAAMCDDFEDDSDSAWLGGLPGAREAIADAPSGDKVWRTSFKSAAMNVTPATDGVSISFWVRVPAGGGDHMFIDWSGPGKTTLAFGIEGDAYRFRLASSPTAYAAPELLKYTRSARREDWTCVELVYVNATFQATVTVLGEAPVKLALVGGDPNAGIDEQMLTEDPQAFEIGPEWTLGETGTDFEFDAVRVVPLGQRSVCEDFITANNP